MQNRQLQTWLCEDEYAQIEAEWEEQLALRETLKDKPSDLKRYEEKLREAILIGIYLCNRRIPSTPPFKKGRKNLLILFFMEQVKLNNNSQSNI